MNSFRISVAIIVVAAVIGLGAVLIGCMSTVDKDSPSSTAAPTSTTTTSPSSTSTTTSTSSTSTTTTTSATTTSTTSTTTTTLLYAIAGTITPSNESPALPWGMLRVFCSTNEGISPGIAVTYSVVTGEAAKSYNLTALRPGTYYVYARLAVATAEMPNMSRIGDLAGEYLDGNYPLLAPVAYKWSVTGEPAPITIESSSISGKNFQLNSVKGP